MSDAIPPQADIIIAGGGTVGISMALALLKLTRFSVAVIDPNGFSAGANGSSPDTRHPSFDARSIALAQHSCEFLSRLGIPAEALGCPISHIHVSDRGHLGQCQLHAEEYRLPQLGRVVELSHLGQALHAALQDEASVDTARLHLIAPARVEGVERQQSQLTVTLDSGESVAAKLLLIAEGGHSATRAAIGLDADTEDYQQTAVIANIGLSQPHGHWAYERFTTEGPLALLPLDDEQGMARASLVWTLDPPRAEAMLNCSESEFLSQLQQAFGYRLGQFIKVGERAAYPLSLIKANAVTSHRVALLGNASQSLHPIAGQGFNLALRDVRDMADILSAASDAGAFQYLRAFDKARSGDRQRVITATDALVRCFSNQHLPLVVGRNVGLSLLNLMSPAKSAFAHGAMGLSHQRHTARLQEKS